jgi:hypothetical protein
MDYITKSHMSEFYENVQQLIRENSKPILQQDDIVDFLDSLQNRINEDFKTDFYFPDLCNSYRILL